jgi:type III restriction enzyme
MIELKRYQKEALENLNKYLEFSSSYGAKGAKEAYDKVRRERFGSNEYKPFQPLKGLESVPYVCLRLPTGGGKTLLSVHSIVMASRFTEKKPLVLYLVPTDAIKSQTMKTLKNPKHPNYKVLENKFDGKFKVFDITEFRIIRPQDIDDYVCIIVSTFASFRVEDKDGRKVYDHDENLESHFSKIPNNVEGMQRYENGKIKYSFENLLKFYRPLAIVDEAHNNKSKLSVEVLSRVNPSCIIEYTATPAKNSNIITSISASELKAEEMIKLPIILSKHNSWESAIPNWPEPPVISHDIFRLTIL